MQMSRPPSTSVRAKKFGIDNQIAHEAEGRYRRGLLVDKFKKSHDDAKKKGATKVRKAETGANSGTYGGSRGSLTSAFFGK